MCAHLLQHRIPEQFASIDAPDEVEMIELRIVHQIMMDHIGQTAAQRLDIRWLGQPIVLAEVQGHLGLDILQLVCRWCDVVVAPMIPQPAVVELAEFTGSAHLAKVLHLLGGRASRSMADHNGQHCLVQLQLVKAGGQEDHIGADLFGDGCLIADQLIEHHNEFVFGQKLMNTNQPEHKL